MYYLKTLRATSTPDRNELRGFEESELNCSLPAILEFPNMMRRKTWWAPVVCLFASLYIFVILAVVCDDYLLPAMERLCYGKHASVSASLLIYSPPL